MQQRLALAVDEQRPAILVDGHEQRAIGADTQHPNLQCDGGMSDYSEAARRAELAPRGFTIARTCVKFSKGKHLLVDSVKLT
jgi:hypothetical protein